MPPRRERPLPTRSARRGRGRLRQGQPDLRGEESTVSPFRATLAAEPVEIPPPPTGIPAVSSEVIQAMAAFFTAMAGQAQTSQVPPVVPPVTPSVPLAHDVSISKKLKEARQLGCVSFVGELDATAAKDWINQVSETLSDMRLEDEMKLIVATRLLEKRARTWWNSVKSRSTILLTWSDFLREFDSQYYTHFHQKEKKREFLSLKQGNLTIEEYETQFNELLSYVPDLLANENRRMRAELAKRKNLNMSSSQPLKRSKGSFVSGSAPSVSVTSSRPSFSQMQQRPPRFSGSAVTTSEKSFGGFDRCRECGRFHGGVCWGPLRCFHCGQTGHFRTNCPQLGQATVAALSSSTRTDLQMRDSSGAQPRQGVAIRPDVESNTPVYPPSKPLTRASTKVFTVMEDEARVQPRESE
ncbi:Gag protease polyprotein, putative [Theobroma cacao]|uniref:Gag protease polyprotein, putative n=1 Tax=Theobroma cacao TaxID=3641 RepID=A0A061G9Q7_THECC|nr:Gag protease polyprotein, putative [Theobroma cacao]